MKIFLLIVLSFFLLPAQPFPTTALVNKDTYVEERTEVFETYREVIEEYLTNSVTIWEKIKLFFGLKNRNVIFIYVSLDRCRIDIARPIKEQLSSLIGSLQLAKTNLPPATISVCAKCVESIWNNDWLTYFTMVLGVMTPFFPKFRGILWIIWGGLAAKISNFWRRQHTEKETPKVSTPKKAAPKNTSTPVMTPDRPNTRSSPNRILRETLQKL